MRSFPYPIDISNEIFTWMTLEIEFESLDDVDGRQSQILAQVI